MFAIIENNEVVQYPVRLTDIQKAHPNTTFSQNPSDEILTAFDAARVYFSTPPEHDTRTQVPVENTPVYSEQNERWEQAWRIDSKSVEQMAAETDAQAAYIRATRDDLLKNNVDVVNPLRWESMSEAQRDALRAYRQALLDVPQQAGFPWDVVWPELN